MSHDERIPVLMPCRPDGGERDVLRSFVQEWFWRRLEGAYRGPILGESPDGPFNRAAAINDAARRAGDWDLAVIADGDVVVPDYQLSEAVQLARRTGRMVAPFTAVLELDRESTRTLVGHCAAIWPWGLRVERVRTSQLGTQSLMLVVPRRLWDSIGGFDEGFVGWGGEDNAFWRAAEILGGAPLRVDGGIYHLYHETTDPVTRSMDPQWRANFARWRRYEQATCECSLRRAQQS